MATGGKGIAVQCRQGVTSASMRAASCALVTSCSKPEESTEERAEAELSGLFTKAFTALALLPRRSPGAPLHSLRQSSEPGASSAVGARAASAALCRSFGRAHPSTRFPARAALQQQGSGQASAVAPMASKDGWEGLCLSRAHSRQGTRGVTVCGSRKEQQL